MSGQNLCLLSITLCAYISGLSPFRWICFLRLQQMRYSCVHHNLKKKKKTTSRRQRMAEFFLQSSVRKFDNIETSHPIEEKERVSHSLALRGNFVPLKGPFAHSFIMSETIWTLRSTHNNSAQLHRRKFCGLPEPNNSTTGNECLSRYSVRTTCSVFNEHCLYIDQHTDWSLFPYLFWDQHSKIEFPQRKAFILLESYMCTTYAARN